MSEAPYRPILTAEQIGDYAYAAGFRGESLAIAVAIARAESGGRVAALGDTTITNATWGPSVGLWQIRSLNEDKGTKRTRDQLALFDPAFNARSAWTISGGGKNFGPWSVYTNGSYKNFLQSGRDAANSAGSRGGSAGSTSIVEGDITYVVPLQSRLPVEPIAPVDPKDIVILGNSLPNLVGEAVRGGTVDMSSDEVSQIQIDLIDPDFLVWGSSWKTQRAPVNWGGWKLELAGASAGEENNVNFTTLTFWPRGVSELKSKQGQIRQNLTPGQWIEAEASAVGMSVINYEAHKAPRPTIGPDDSTEESIPGLTVQSAPKEPESAWKTMTRLASEDGCILFALPEGTIVYGKPTILARALSFFDVGFRGSAGGDPALDFVKIKPELTVDSSSWITVNKIATVWLPRWRGERVRPGMNIRLPGFSGFESGEAIDQDHYIVKQVSWDLDDVNSDVELRVELAVNPIATGEKSSGASLGNPQLGEPGTSANGLPKGTKSANDFVAFAQAQAGDSYVYGASVNTSNADPSAFDCSSLVQWAAAQVGISLPRTSDAQLNACTPISIDTAKKTRGALIGRKGSGANGHVVISLGNGSTIEARGSKYGVVNASVDGRGFDAAGLIPGMNYGGTKPIDYQNSVATPGYESVGTPRGNW